MRYSTQSIGHFVELLGEEFAGRVAITYFHGYRTYRFTYRDLFEQSRKVGAFLMDRGLSKGDRVLICAENSPEWAATLLACGLTGIVLVPVDRKSSRDLLDRIAQATDPQLLITDRSDLADSAEIEVVDIDTLFDRVAGIAADSLAQRDGYVTSDDLLEIVFTSGTTSEPKGAVIRQRNVVANLRALRLSLRFDPSWKLLSLLPLSHMLEQTVGCLAPLRFGCEVVYHKRKSFADVAAIIREQGITTIVAVPAVLELFKKRIEERAAELGSSAKLTKLTRVGAKLPFVLRRPLSRPVRKGLGQRLTAFICGGGPLASNVEDFWESMGIRVIQGYGLTEASPIVTCNSFELRARGSVGRVLKEQRIKLADDGEIFVAGENVISGYHERPDLDSEYFEEGWYRTGDIGRQDELGNLYIIGRKKNMIVGSSGMNVYPEDIEAALAARPEIVEAVVFADERSGAGRVVAAVLTDDETTDLEQVRTAVNDGLEPHQRLADLFRWHEDDFPRTPTLKIKRGQVIEGYRGAGGEPAPAGPTTAESAIDKIANVVRTVTGADRAQIQRSSRLAEDLGVDSLKAVELAVALETAFRVTVDETRLTGGATIADVVEMLDGKSAPQPACGARAWPLRGPARLARGLLLPLFQALVLRLLLGVKIRATSKPTVAKGRPVIYVANHQSHLDTPAILAALPAALRKRVAVAAANDHFFAGHRLRGFFGQLLFNMFPFHRTGSFRTNLASVGRCLDAGFSVLVFPEGTRSRDGSIGPFKPGIGQIVCEMGVPVVPLHISGAHELLPPDRSLPRRGSVRISVGQQLELDREPAPAITAALEQAVRRFAETSSAAQTAAEGGPQ
jgi:long-chain acyl-CoA synthetase